MPRRGWSSLPVPDGWFEVIRGPRPPSVQWPHQQKGKDKGVALSAPRGRWRNPDRGTRAPAQTRGDPPTRRRALEVLGEDSGPETPHPTNGSSRLRTGIGSVESLRAQLSMRGERRSRGRSRSLPNPSPDLSAGELQRSAVGSHRLSSVMETLIDNAESSARSNHRFNPM